jgi:CRISPR-associated endonuclease/helicase Cas3
MDKDKEEAKDRYIEAPDYRRGRASLDEIAGWAREEDAPELHPALQAMTRLADPSVRVIVLYRVGNQTCLDPAGREPVNLKKGPDMPTIVRLLKRSLTLSGRGIVQRVLEREGPAGWARSPLLRNYRAIVLDADGRAAEGDYALRLDPDEGLIVSKEGKEVL